MAIDPRFKSGDIVAIRGSAVPAVVMQTYDAIHFVYVEIFIATDHYAKSAIVPEAILDPADVSAYDPRPSTPEGAMRHFAAVVGSPGPQGAFVGREEVAATASRLRALEDHDADE